MGTQKKGGCFILKIFDITTKPTLQFLSLLTYFYEDVFINKPVNSRPCNSEKYIYAKNFKECNENTLDILITFFDEWKNDYLIDMNIIVPKEQFQPIRRFNNYFTSLQTKMILGTIRVIYNPIKFKKYLELLEKKKKKVTEYYYNFMFRSEIQAK